MPKPRSTRWGTTVSKELTPKEMAELNNWGSEEHQRLVADLTSPITGREPMLSQDEPVLCYVSGAYAYFTTCALDKQWGDDWNDAPYEHNAGRPYDWREGRDVPPYRIECLMWDGPFETPADIANGNSRYSVDMINAGAVAWLTPDRWVDNPHPIRAGATVSEFKRLVKSQGGRIFVEEK